MWDELDEKARRQLESETNRHRRTLDALALSRDADAGGREAIRHFDRVTEIMLGWKKRNSVARQNPARSRTRR